MISVLIPVYNYSIKFLVESLMLQFETIDCDWEIFLSDDVSETHFKNLNANYIESLNIQNVKLFSQDVNVGNAANRNYLIDKASYDWLLFLDADVLPVNNNFISVYLSMMEKTEKDLISGNIIYDVKKPLPHLLRWKYGKKKEEISLEKRKSNAIINLRGANFAIRKSLARKYNMPLLKEKYGFVDTRFFLQFDEKQVCVIENAVYHLGIEENDVYLLKTKQAIINAHFLMNTNDKLSKQITLVFSYQKIRAFRRILAKYYFKYRVRFENNLLSRKPSIIVFQLFKILFLSSLDVVEDID